MSAWPWQRPQAEEGNIHLPNPSYYPLLAGIGLFLLAFGILIHNPHIQLGFFGIPIVSAARVPGAGGCHLRVVFRARRLNRRC